MCTRAHPYGRVGRCGFGEQGVTQCTHTHPYKHTHANPTPRTIFEDCADTSNIDEVRLAVDGNVTYH
jgi:hypothetical protein